MLDVSVCLYAYSHAKLNIYSYCICSVCTLKDYAEIQEHYA